MRRGRVADDSAQLVGVGHLIELVYRDQDDREHTLHPRNIWLAWDVVGKAFFLGKSRGYAPGGLRPDITAAHRRFHKANPTRIRRIFLPEAQGNVRGVGLVESMSYFVPDEVKSDKNGDAYIHTMGDHGEKGHGRNVEEKRYSSRLMPLLAKDSRGNLFIIRRKGNRFFLKDWIYW